MGPKAYAVFLVQSASMNRIAIGTHSYAQSAGLWGSDLWGTIAIFLFGAAMGALAVGLYMLIKSGRRHEQRKKPAPEYSKHSNHPPKR
jgi:hypothetical protein